MFKTSADSAVAYQIGNPGMNEGCLVTLTLDEKSAIRAVVEGG